MSKELIDELRANANGQPLDVYASIMNSAADALESQAREIERLRLNIAEYNEHERCYQSEIVALKAQSGGVVLPLMAALESVVHDERVPNEVSQEVAAVLIEARRLNSSPVSSGDPEKCSYQDDPRSPAELSLAGCNCVRFGEGNPHWPCKLHTPVSAGEPVYQFQCREIGEGDWEPCDHSRYMYCQKSPEMDTRVVQVQAISAPSHGDQVRHMVLAGWKLVPVEPTPEMISAAEEAHMPFGDMDIALRCALFAAPSAGSQEEQGE